MSKSRGAVRPGVDRLSYPLLDSAIESRILQKGDMQRGAEIPYTVVSVALSAPIAVDRIVDRVRYYSNGKFPFGVLAFGTCFLPKGGRTFAQEAQRLLDEVAGAPLDFVVREMDDRNFVVRFTEHIFGIVFKDEFEASRGDIERELEESLTSEKLVGKPAAPADDLLVGLFSRTRLIQDLQTREVVRTVKTIEA